MGMQLPRLSRQTLVLVVAMGLLSIPALVVHLTAVTHPADDAYITFRYAEKLLAGDGLVYNAGERVFGSTTPLYTFWLAGLKGFMPTVPFEVVSVRSNIVPFFIVIAGVFFLVLKLSQNRLLAAATTGYLLLSVQMLEISISGMESMFFLALVVWSFVAAVGRRIPLACILAAGATMTRPEGVFCLIPVAFMVNWGSVRSLVGAGCAYLVPMLAWVLPAWLYYGSPVPHSIIAKAAPLYVLAPGATTAQMANMFVYQNIP